MRVNMHNPPESGTFERVLRRTDRHLGLAANLRVQSYAASVRGRAIAHPDGVDAITLFFPKREKPNDIVAVNAAADRQLKLGWKDVTELWAQYNKMPPQTPTNAEELIALEWTQLVALAAKHGVKTSGRKRAKVAEETAIMMGFVEPAVEPANDDAAPNGEGPEE